MTEEEAGWLRLSLRLHKTPAEVMHQVTWVDFIRYQKLFEDEVNEPDKRDWYDAQTAYEIHCIPYRVWGKSPPTGLSLKSFLMKFGKPDPVIRGSIDDAINQDIVENYSQLQMMYWGAAVGAGMPGETPEVDDSPVKTMLPPDMRDRVRPAGEPTASAVSQPPPPGGPTGQPSSAPRGGFSIRKKRGH